jgi:transcriptional regulator with XRE-family HTH domain
MDIASVIRDGRREKRLSQRALAERMGVAPSAVAQWETGITNPSLANRVDLAAILSVPFASLLPEAADIGQVSSKDPQTIILVRKFEGLPPRVREAILMQVVATAESLEAVPSEDGPKDSSAKK